MDDARPRFWRSRPHHPSLTFALAVAALCCVAPSHSADDPAPPDRWEFRITASAMAADLSGTTRNVWGRTVGGSIIYDERDYSDVFPDPQPLYLVDLAASHGPWGVVVRGQLLDWNNVVLLASRTRVEETAWFVETDVSHRIGAHWIVFVGFRYVDLEHSEEVLLNSSNPDFPPIIASWGHTWLDPLVGAALSYRLAHRWELAGRGDLGGFGVGSDLSWDLDATVQWAFAPHIALIGGYRIFDVHFAEDRTYGGFAGSRITLPDTYDTRIDGPTLGLTFHW